MLINCLVQEAVCPVSSSSSPSSSSSFSFLPLILPLSSFSFLFLFYVYEYSACISVCACVQYWWRPERRCQLLLEPRCCKTPSRFWELNPSSLEKQPSLLSVESSLLPQVPSSYSQFSGSKEMPVFFGRYLFKEHNIKYTDKLSKVLMYLTV